MRGEHCREKIDSSCLTIGSAFKTVIRFLSVRGNTMIYDNLPSNLMNHCIKKMETYGWWFIVKVGYLFDVM